MITELTTAPCYNPFLADGFTVSKIVFYNDDKTVFETARGWFGNNNRFRSLFIGSTTKRNKIVLNRKENFYVRDTEKDAYGEKYVALYLYVDGENIKVEDLGTHQDTYNKVDVWTHHKYKIRIYGDEIEEEVVDKIEKNEFGQQVEALKKDLAEINIKLTSFDLVNLLEHYELVKRS